MTELIFHDAHFESTVRELLNIFDRTVTDADALRLGFLDLSNFTFRNAADLPALMQFRNLHTLHLEFALDDFSFLRAFPRLTELSLTCTKSDTILDLHVLSHLHSLKELLIRGDAEVYIELPHLEALTALHNLRGLWLYDTCAVDLAPLRGMPWLESFDFGYSIGFQNIEAIGFLSNLKELHLIDIAVDDLSFLESLPADIERNLLHITVGGQTLYTD